MISGNLFAHIKVVKSVLYVRLQRKIAKNYVSFSSITNSLASPLTAPIEPIERIMNLQNDF